MTWYTYILLCDNEIYYTGLTSNLRNRLISHKAKLNFATKRFSKIKLVYSEKYATRKEAERREQQVKRWKRAKKKALINGDSELLKKLSKS